MADTPNVAGMVADPDFQSLAPAEKRAALGQLTGDKSFASLNDGETMQFVSRFAPAQQPKTSPYPAGTFQSKKGGPLMQDVGAGFPVPMGARGSGASLSKGGQPAQEPDAQGTLNALPWIAGGAAAAVTGGTSLLGQAGMAAAGGVGGNAIQQGIERMSGMRSDLSAGEEMKTGAKVGATELFFGGANKYVLGPIAKFGGKQIAKLFGETPERIAELKALPQTEEAIRSRIVQTEADSRTAFKEAYPKIDAAPVNVAATKNLAQQASKELGQVATVPKPMSRVANIPEPSQNVLTSDDPATILKELAGFDNVPFRQAQQYRSAIEKYISTARPPANVYNALKQVSGSLTNGLESTAAREGVLKEFQAAEAMFKQHAADFWNKGAPLKPFMQVPENATGATLNKFTQAATQSRALDALNRRGVPVADLKGILAKGSKSVKADIKDAATVRNLGEGTLNKQVAGVNRAAAKKTAVKIGLGSVGASGLYELMRSLATSQKPAQ